PPVDMKDPISVAHAFVDAYNTRDLSRMLPLFDQVNMDAIKAALSGGPESEAWRGIFAPEMVAILSREQGKVDGPRYDRRDAVVKVGASGDGDAYAIVLSKGKDDNWLIVENAVLSEAEFEAMSTEPPKKRK
ncbi:MAG: hypothetical protein ABMA14_26920, partial [Hyphomonadaceae bacterium]